MTWMWSAPDGVYKNHALSSQIRREAIADVQFMRFLRPEPGYGRGRGQSVTITRVGKLPMATRVSELDRLPSGNVSISTKTVDVSEWGFKLELTEFERDLTHFDITNTYQRLLRDQISLTMDSMSAEALKETKYKYIPVTTGGVFDTDGVASTQADKNMTVADLRNIYDELRGTLKAPTFRGGRYVGILSTKAARGIKNDQEFKDWLAPTSSEQFGRGTAGGGLPVIENIALFETNHTDVLAEDLGASGVLGESIFFGADPGFLAVIREPELRASLPDQNDLGRFRHVGWVGTIEAALSWEQASTSRVIHVTSS